MAESIEFRLELMMMFKTKLKEKEDPMEAEAAEPT